MFMPVYAYQRAQARANNDAMALGALDALKSRGYNTDVKDKDQIGRASCRERV